MPVGTVTTDGSRVGVTVTLHYADDWLTVYHGDAATELRSIDAESVHCVVTSPPYWGLRDYGTATWTGGDEGCDHVADVGPPLNKSTLTSAGIGATPEGAASKAHARQFRRVCRRCGATRIDSQLGLEPTPEAYVAALVDVFREVRRVLRSDGTVWLNLGDSYASMGRTGRKESPGVGAKQEMARVERDVVWAERDDGDPNAHFRWSLPGGQKPKDLVGIPWMVAFALRADGWYLRSDIIWSKPNPMPESVTDRPTKSHEYLFLLSKSARYYFDADAVREATQPYEFTSSTNEGLTKGPPAGLTPQTLSSRRGRAEKAATYNPAGRNIRSVWTVATQPYPGAHFATFPPKLIEPCILAGTSERGVCPECGAPWVREVERTGVPRNIFPSSVARQPDGTAPGDRSSGLSNGAPQVTTTGWHRSCDHVTEPVPATVLDPFAGSGTTGLVAQKHSRRAVLIDLSMDYLGQLMDRNRDIPLGLGA